MVVISVCKFYSLISPHSVKSENPFKTAGRTTLQLLIHVLACSHLLFLGFWLFFCLVLSPPGPSSHLIFLSFSFCVLFATWFWNVERMPTSVPVALGKDGMRVVPTWSAGMGSARKPCVCPCQHMPAAEQTCSEMRGQLLNWQTFWICLLESPVQKTAMHLVKRNKGVPRLF